MLAIFDASFVGLGFVDCDFRIIDINAVLASINGGAVEDQIGRLVADVAPYLWPQLEPIYRRVVDEEETMANVELKNRTANDGKRDHRWLCSYYPVKSDDTVIGIGIVALDISERIRAAVCSCSDAVTADDEVRTMREDSFVIPEKDVRHVNLRRRRWSRGGSERV
jgi:PAS domain-containing protein